MTADTHTLETLDTPAALIDLPRMQHNIARMQHRMNALGVKFRPHVKTTKCLDVVRAQVAAGAQGILVRTGHGRTAEAAPRSGPGGQGRLG